MEAQNPKYPPGTVPPNIVIKNQRLDLVVVWDDPKQIMVVALTVPFEFNISDAHQRKVGKYKMLIQDISEAGYTVTFEAIEIQQRGL